MVSKLQLPKLQKKEDVAVTSSVIDVFYRPDKKPVSPVLGELARSLSTVIPRLKEYEISQEQIEQTEQESQADVDFRKNNMKDFSALVKDGTIKAGANPYYVQKYVKNSLREKAREFEAGLFDEYDKQDILSSTNPSAFNDFYKQYASDFAAKNNLSLFDNVSMAEGFIPYVEATRSNLANQHINGRVAEIEKDQKELLRKTVEGIIFDNADIEEEDLNRALAGYENLESLDYEEKKTLFMAQSIQEEIDELIALDLDPKEANDLVVNKVIDIAKAAGNEELLDILQNIVTDKESGARLAGSYQELLLSAVFDIQAIQDNRELSDLRKIEQGKKLRKEDTLNYFIYKEGAMLDVENAIEQYNLELAMQNQPPLTYDEILSIRALSDSFIKGLEMKVIPSKEGSDFIVDITTMLAEDPQNPNLPDMIRKGLDNEYYNTDDFKTFMNTYFSRSKLESNMYFTDLRFNTEIGNFNTSVGVLVNEQGLFEEEFVENIATGKTQLLSFSYDLIEALNDPEYLAKNKLTNDFEKKQHFFEMLEKERKRLVNAIVPDMSTIRQETDPVDKIIKGENVYNEIP